MTYSYDRRAARPIPLDKSQLQRLASDIVKELPRHLKFRDMSAPLWQTRGFSPQSWGFEVGPVETTDVRGIPIRLKVHVGAKKTTEWRSPRKYVTGGSVRTVYHADGGGKAKGYGYKTGISVTINSVRSPEEILSNIDKVRKELFSVLIHEVTHLRDLLKHEGYEDHPEDPDKYYNAPSEVRAFMQQIADELIEYAHELGKDDPWFLPDTPDSDFLHKALESSGTWERVRGHLTRSNEKLMLRGVTRALQDEWPKLKELYVEEED